VKNNQQDYAPHRVAKATAAFLELRRSTLAERERELEHNRYVFSLQLEERRRQAEQARQLLVQSGIELEQLERLDAEQDIEGHLQERFANGPRYRHMGEAPTLLGADLATYANAADEPTFVWLYEAGSIDLDTNQQGGEWSCLFLEENPDYVDPTADWWYTWTPPEDGVYSFWAIAPYSGFYIIRANDAWYNCKYAKAHAFVEVDVHQYFWRGPDRRTIVDKRGSNIQETGLASGALQWFFNEPLNADDEVTVRVTTTLDVFAKGTGDYAELNFSEGEGNYLGTPGVFITKV
jgi:hypothetical protein